MLTTTSSSSTSTELTKRIRNRYSLKDQKIYELESLCILHYIDVMNIKGQLVLYDNQDECAEEVSLAFRDRKIVNIMVTAQTQSGKTGTMIALIKHYLSAHSNILPIENIYIITGHSSVEWIEQTKARIPEPLHKRVFHRDDLTRKFVKDIMGKKNVLVIIDEIQIAAKEHQTLYKVFAETGFYNKQYLLQNDVKIVEFTATPDGTIYDLMRWGENATKIQMDPGVGYTSSKDLLDQGRVLQYQDLYCGNKDKRTGQIIINEEQLLENMTSLREVILSYDTPMYHIIRTGVGIKSQLTIENFKRHFPEYLNDTNVITYDKESDVKDINIILNIPPKSHTFIFLKEKLRCAKTLCKTFIGVAYERYTRSGVDDAVIIQGLVGRLTGYDDNGRSICFTNVESIVKYGHLWDSKFEDTSVKWHSKTTKRVKKILRSRGTYNNPKFIDGMDVSNEESEELEPVIHKFNSFEEAKNFVKYTLGNARGPMNPWRRNTNSDGFLECKMRRTRKVWSVAEMYTQRKCNIKNGAGYGFRYCYRDVTDKDTLEFWIIYYDESDDTDYSK